MPELYNDTYHFVKEINKGGFGRVFLAKEKVADRFVAIKELLEKDEDSQYLIIHEINTVAKLNHPNIITYYTNFNHKGLLCLVMEYCSSGSLRDAMYKKKEDPATVFQWVQKLAETLQFIHEQGIIHHDIKPDNILVNEHGTLKISDFGVANMPIGTIVYLSPEALTAPRGSIKDPRIDIYALGVTLMELLTGINPFRTRTREEILDLHEAGEFPIKKLPDWQQEIILKAINKVPELRFQSMKDFAEAIQAKAVPMFLNKDLIKAGDMAEKAGGYLKRKKWKNAKLLLEHSNKIYPDNVNILKVYGKYYLLRQQIKDAKHCYENALKLNPRLDVQKDLGWLNLALQNYPTAISLLNDHLHRNPSDYEAGNLLLQCYFETNRYEAGMELAQTLFSVDNKNPCFASNYYLCCAMHNIGQVILPNTVLKMESIYNEFIDYNYSVVAETESTNGLKNKPTLKSKLLFMDYRFIKMNPGTLYYTEPGITTGKMKSMDKLIIKIGRKGYLVNDIQIPGGTGLSRRHSLIVNCKNDVWLYDLGSTKGTYLNGELLIDKAPLIGLNTLKNGELECKVTSDQSNLL